MNTLKEIASPERAADHRHLRNDVVSAARLNSCHADNWRVRRLDVARDNRLERGHDVTISQHEVNSFLETGTV